jgi:hypothetical protein
MGLYKDNDLVILSPQRHVELHRDPLGKDEILPPSSNQALTDSAIAYYQGGDYVLRHELLKALPQKQ